MFRIASRISLVAASSLGKSPRVLIILRSRALMLSIALAVYTAFRTAGGNTKNGITLSHARRRDATTVGNF